MRYAKTLLIPTLAFVIAPIGDVAAQKKEAVQGTAPKIIIAMPMAVEPGKTTKLVVRGLRLDSVTGVRIQEPKSKAQLIGKGRKVALPANSSADQLGDSEIDIEVTLSKEAAGRTASFSLIGPGGESKPHQLIVKDDTPVIVEHEPNDGFKQAQPVRVPCIVEGSIRQPQDVDVFRIDGKKGDRLVFELQANRFGSPLDGILTLYDEAGAVIASADDSPGSLDPILEVTLPQSGTFFLSLIDAHDQGGSTYLYRLVIRNPGSQR